MEVCVDSVQSAINAETGGASRIELCSSLIEGGTTPSLGTLRVIKKRTKIPVFSMVRPRGGDFCYTDVEIEVMKEEIICLKEENVDGIVIGAVTSSGDVDVNVCKELLDVIRPLPATFHRAIDVCRDPIKDLEVLTELGFQHVLTSGGMQNAFLGRHVIKEMVEKAGTDIVVMPGGGIREDNLAEILSVTKAKTFHGSARESLNSNMEFRKVDLSFGPDKEEEYKIKVTSPSVVNSFLRIAQTVWSS